MLRTRGGFGLRAYGENPRAAALYGAPPNLPIYAFLASGALCGLAALHYVGSKGFHEDGFSGGVGFVGLAVALTASERPLLVVPAALRIVRLRPGRKFTNIGELCTVLGWKQAPVLATLEAKRKVKSAAYYEKKKILIREKAKVAAELPVNPLLAIYGM